ncbi:hypothetical protein [Nocardioides psychrotolerans]|uniref:hypothetical protein n=1 Tax=Nocardioides psychrotolerans TaxID=1005945 RepID=UPI003137DACC
MTTEDQKVTRRAQLLAAQRSAESFARLEVQRLVENHEPNPVSFQALERAAARDIRALEKNRTPDAYDDELLRQLRRLRLEAAKSRIIAQARSTPVAETARSLAALAAESLEQVPGTRTARDISTQATRYARQAGDDDWVDRYQALIDVREADGDPYGAAMARANLAVAYRAAAENPRLSEAVRDAHMLESYDRATVEWDHRVEAVTESSAHTWVAMAIRVRACLTALYRGKPIKQPDEVLEMATRLAEARAALIGSTHVKTVGAQMLQAQARTFAGDPSRSFWELRRPLVFNDVEATFPGMLPFSLSHAAFAIATPDFTRQAERFRAETVNRMSAHYGPDSQNVLWAREVLGDEV